MEGWCSYMNGDIHEKYFCAANSGGGFISFYPQLISESERVFVIKGGPGTGKSRFLHSIAERAERTARKVVYYYCSSDPTSLDAVSVDSRILFLDGTAPHAVEAAIPGARDDLIDLGRFWDSARLIGQRRRIAGLSELKASAYSSAYDYLASAAALTHAVDRRVDPAVLMHKLRAAAERSLRTLPDGGGFSLRRVALDSYGMRGQVRFSTFFDTATEYIAINDCFGTAHHFLSALVEVARERKMAVTASVDPLIPERFDALRFEDSGRVYELGVESDKPINMKRFIDITALRDYRDELKATAKLCRASLDSALSSLSNAAKAHFALEKIYGEAMDFAAKEDFTDSFIGQIL